MQVVGKRSVGIGWCSIVAVDVGDDAVLNLLTLLEREGLVLPGTGKELGSSHWKWIELAGE